MEKLIVDADGKITIPPHILEKRGLRPGDELSLVEAAEGLHVYQSGLDTKTESWWKSLSEEERNRLWEEDSESIEPDSEGVELDLMAR